MALDVGADMVARSGCIGNCLDTTFTYMTSTNGGSYQAASAGLFVAGDGVRFVDENSFSFARTAAMLGQGFSFFCSIFDQKSYVEGLDKAIDAGRAFKADIIADLATAIGMGPETLENTVERYNELCTKGVDEDFNKPAEFLSPVDEGPYYAILYAYVISGTFGGIKTTTDAEVLDKSGNVIPGLYTAGEVANGQYLCYEYPDSGTALESYMTMGRQAGRAAATTIAK